MTVAVHNIASSPAIVVAPKFGAMSVADLTMAVDLLSAMRVTAHTASCLANHMRREDLEGFTDDMVDRIDRQLSEIAAALRAGGADREACNTLLARLASMGVADV